MKKINKKMPLILGALSAVALGTVGFSTWILNYENKVSNGEITVTVDENKNSSIDFKMKATSNASINVREHLDAVSQNVSTHGNVSNDSTIQDADLNVEFDATIRVTDDYLKDHENAITSLTFDIGDQMDTLDDTTNTRSESTNTYLTISPLTQSYKNLTATKIRAASEPLDGWTVSKTAVETDGYYTLTQKIKIIFAWGTYFNSTTPATYYNSKAEELAASPENDLFMFYINAEKELDKMKTALDAYTGEHKLKITATLA